MEIELKPIDLIHKANVVYMNGRTIKDRYHDAQMRANQKQIAKSTIKSWKEESGILHLDYSAINCIKDWLKRRIPALRDGVTDIWLSYALNDYADEKVNTFSSNFKKQLEDRVNTLRSTKADWLSPKLDKDMTNANIEARIIDEKIKELTAIIDALKTKING